MPAWSNSVRSTDGTIGARSSGGIATSSAPSRAAGPARYSITTSSSGLIAAPISFSVSRRLVTVAIGVSSSVSGLFRSVIDRPRVSQRSSIACCAASTSVRHGAVARVAGEGNEIEIDLAGPLVVEIRQRIVEQRLLRRNHRFRRGVRVAVTGCRARSAPPRLGRRQRGRERDRRGEQQPAGNRPGPAMRLGRKERDGDDANEQRERPDEDHHVEYGADPVRHGRDRRHRGRQRMHDLDDGIGGEREQRDRQRERALPERERQDRRAQEQHAAGDELAARAVPGESGVRPVRSQSLPMSSSADSTNSSRSCARSIRNANRDTGRKSARRAPATRLRPSFVSSWIIAGVGKRARVRRAWRGRITPRPPRARRCRL